MSDFVESLRRLFRDGMVTEEILTMLWHKQKITRSEYDYITTGKEG